MNWLRSCLILFFLYPINLIGFQNDVNPVLDLTFEGSVFDSALNHTNITKFKELFTVDRKGNENDAFYFDGTKDSRLVIPYKRWDEGTSIWHDKNSYKKDSNLLMFWVKIDGFIDNEGDLEAIIFEKGNQSPIGTIGISPDKIVLNSMWSDLRRDVDIEFKTGVWYHLGFILDPNTETIRVYRNGSFVKEWVSTWFPTSDNGLLDLKIGNSVLTGSRFKGSLDDIKFYHTGNVENYIRIENDLMPVQRVDSTRVLNLKFNTDLTDSSITNNEVSNQGGLFVPDRFGNFDRAYEFKNQGDKLSINFEDSTKAFNDFSKFSITSWLKIDAFNENGSVIFQKPNYFRTAESYTPERNKTYQISQGFKFFINRNGRLSLLVDKSDNYLGGIRFTDGNLKVLPQNEWLHVAAVYDNGDFKLYINGELQSMWHKYISNSDWKNIKGGSMLIGNDSTSESTFFGQIDDLEIFDYTISSEEIAGMIDFTEPEKSFEPKELLFLPFDSVNSDKRIIFGDIELKSENFTIDRFNNVKGSYSFDSVSVPVQIKNMDSVYDSVSKGLTISSWIRIDSLRSFSFEDEYHSAIVSRIDQKYSDKFSFGVQVGNPHSYLESNESALFLDLNGIKLNAPSDKVQLGYWMHVAGTYDGGKAKLYINGELVAEEEFRIKLNLSNSGVFIGSEENGTAPFFGSMDELRVYNYPIEQEEIQDFYNDRFKGYELGRKELIKLNFNNSLADSSSYSHSFDFGQTALTFSEDRFNNQDSALLIDGLNSSIFLQDSDSILDSLSSSMTATMWVKLNSEGTQHTAATLLSRDDGDMNQYSIKLERGKNSNSNLRQLVFSIGGVELMYIDEPLQSDKWFHVAVSYDGLKMKLYLNGVLRKEFKYSGIIRVNDSRLILGNNRDKSAPFTGSIDDFGLYSYALEDSVIASMIDVEVINVSNEEVFDTPSSVHLHQNYPNPFNPTTQIKFSIPFSDLVNLTVYDIIGRKVKVLINKKLPSGDHQIYFNATDLSSGVYIYRLQTSTTILSKKMTLIK
ncbi:MAG: LamG-like jellyroll fold domain-containing protein [Balneola sp.]|jgi:hypothetical protein